MHMRIHSVRSAAPRVRLEPSWTRTVVEGVLALECISDTEFEGLSDLSTEQEQALVGLGWEQREHERQDMPANDVGAACSHCTRAGDELALLHRQGLRAHEARRAGPAP